MVPCHAKCGLHSFPHQYTSLLPEERDDPHPKCVWQNQFGPLFHKSTSHRQALHRNQNLESAETFQIAQCSDRIEKERIARRYCRRVDLGDGESFDFNYYVWLVGDAIFVGVPAEALSVFQVELRVRFPEFAIICMNIANGHIGYLPPASDFESNSYEVAMSFFKKGSLEKLILECVKTIEHLLGAAQFGDSKKLPL